MEYKKKVTYCQRKKNPFDRNMNIADIVPGFLGAIASMIVVWPTEVIKYHKQLSLNSYPEIMRKLWPRGYYTGFIPNAISVIPSNALPAILMDHANHKIIKFIKNPTLTSLTSSLVITSITSAITLPLANISLRRVVYPDASSMAYFYKHPWDLCAGASAYYIKNMTRIGVKMACYDIIRRNMYFTHDWRDAALSGGIATSISAIASNPIDVVLTRQQTSYGRNISFAGVLTEYMKRNPSKLFDGVLIRTARGIPGGMALFGVMEYTKRAIERRGM